MDPTLDLRTLSLPPLMWDDRVLTHTCITFSHRLLFCFTIRTVKLSILYHELYFHTC